MCNRSTVLWQEHMGSGRHTVFLRLEPIPVSLDVTGVGVLEHGAPTMCFGASVGTSLS